MAKRLPGWKVLDAVHRATTKKRPSPSKKTCQGIIITEAKAEKDGLDADVVHQGWRRCRQLVLQRLPTGAGRREKKDVSSWTSGDTFDRRAVQDAQPSATGIRNAGMGG